MDGKVVLITGASEGIGAACARAFRSRGARLALTARSASKLAEVSMGNELAVAGDLLSPEDRRRVVEQTEARFGRVDVLVNNAGAGLYGPAWQAPDGAARSMFELNFFAMLDLTQLVVPGMRARREGAIVNVGSVAGKVTLPWMTLYSATKAAVGALTAGLRMELKHDNIHAMTVCPGYVKTDFQAHALGGAPPESVRSGRRFAITPEQCAEAIVRGLERNARTVVTPRVAWLFVGLQRMVPRVMEARLERMQRRIQ